MKSETATSGILMYSHTLKWLIIVLQSLMLSVNSPSAQDWLDRTGAKLLITHTNSGLLSVILGDVKKVSARWVSETDFKLHSQYEDWLYEFPKGTDLANIAMKWQKKQQLTGGSILYQCDGRQCGGSSFYANQVFGIRTLYGRDDNQIYKVGLNQQGNELAIFYGVVRGNRSVQAILRRVSLNREQLSDLKDELDLVDRLSTTENKFDATQSKTKSFYLALDQSQKINHLQSSNVLKSLADWIDSHAEIQAYLVLYTYRTGSLEETQKVSKGYLNEVFARLKQLKTPTKNLELVGAGAIRLTSKGQVLLEWVAKP